MFQLTSEEQEKVATWSAIQDQKVAEKQDRDAPYYGASGGQLTYSFTPTNLGLVVKVFHEMTKETLDLTDYKSW